MSRRSWILAALLLAPAGALAQGTASSARGARGASDAEQFQQDLPDNSEAFREKPIGYTTPDEALTRARQQVRAAQPAALPPSDTGQAGDRMLIGKVVRAEPDQVWVDYQGAMVPLALTPRTRFEGSPGARVDALSPGQEVRARFNVSNGYNVVTDLELTARPSVPAAPAAPGWKLNERQRQERDEPIDTDKRSPSLVPSTGDVRGPANPVDQIPR